MVCMNTLLHESSALESKRVSARHPATATVMMTNSWQAIDAVLQLCVALPVGEIQARQVQRPSGLFLVKE